MPTYQFEAMDATGQEIKDVIEAASRGRSASDDSADGLLRHQDLRQEEPRKRAAEKKAARSGKTFALGGVKLQDPHHLHPPALDPPGRRPADPPQPANPREQCQAGRPEERPDRRLRRNRRRLHPLRGHGQVPQGLQPPLRQHDQGRRGGRCPGSHSPAPGRVPGTVRVAETQGQRRDDLPGRRRHRRRRHLDLHHAQDRAGVREDLRGLRRRTAGHDR